METITKNLKMSGSVNGNTLVGAAAVQGNLDRGADVLFPGLWKGVLGDFLKEGFVPLSHDWGSLPIAMPTKAKEVGAELQVEAEFHSTDEAQKAKTVIAERLAKGMTFGLSVGFMADRDGYAFFETGDALLEFAEKGGWDTSLFDKKAIKAYKGWGLRGIWKAKELFEFSPCSVPMNAMAQVTALKSLADIGSRGDLKFGDHLESVLGAVRGLVIRGRDIHTSRMEEKQQPLGKESVDLLSTVHEQLGSLLQEVETAIAEKSSDRVADASAVNALRAKAAALQLAL